MNHCEYMNTILIFSFNSNFSNSVPKWVCLKSYFTNQCLCSRSRPGKWKLRSRLKIFHSVGLRSRPRYSIPGIFGGWNTEVFWYWWWKEVRNSEISNDWSTFSREGGGVLPLDYKRKGAPLPIDRKKGKELNPCQK